MTPHPHKSNIIWDLSGTLLVASTVDLSIQERADSSLLFSLWAGRKNPSSYDTLALSLLNQLKLPGTRYSGAVRNPAGEPIPEIVYRFLAGYLSAAQASKEATDFFHQWAQKNTAYPRNELPLIRRMIESFFNPTAIVKCFTQEKALVKILHQVARNPTITNYVLSNWDPDSFALIHQKYKDSLFCAIKSSNVVISGSAGSLKPQESIFHYFLTKYHLSPKSCFFIDDQADNLETAKLLGIEGVKFEVNKEDLVERVLHELKVL